MYFFIHGGGNTNGSSNQHDGTKIVHEGHVIVVTINYRLGVLGSLGHPALTAEQGESGDYGFQDQQAALLWVHRNIAAFGGDPRQVTIGGQSSGAQSVCTHLSAPGSSGLFSAAIIQSAPDCFTDNPADAATEALGLASVVGCGDAVTALTCLRAADTQTLLNAGNDTSFSGFYTNGTRTIPIDPRQAIKSGAFRHVPTIIGFTRDEVRTFVVGDIGLSEQEYVDSVARDMGPISDQVLAHYPWPADADQFTPAYLRAAMFTDRYFACGDPPIVDDFASHTRTWVYEFDHRDGPGLQPNPVGYVWGAGHAVDLAYLWPSFDNGTPIAATFTPAEQQLAGQMVQYWSAFVKRSNPVVQGQAFWPRYNRSIQRLSLQAGNDTRAITDAEFSAEHQCDFWRSVSASS